MAKQAISVTLRPENLLWLRGRARALRQRSVSEVLDHVLTEVRTGGVASDGAIRSVVGTIRIARSDPYLSRADAAVRALLPGGAGITAKRRVTGNAGSTLKHPGTRG